jgi:hypothetical protein
MGQDLKRIRRELATVVTDDLVRLEVTQAIMRPLAEGLALFAEYDAISRVLSAAWSPLPVAIAWNFAGADRIDKTNLPEPYRTLSMAGELVSGARLSRHAIAAKASVLAQPLSSTAGGYLPGYLAVKNMWRHLYRQGMRIYGESDIALAYLRSFFYEDQSLAAAILSPPETDISRGSNDVIEAFTRRLSEFGRVTLDDVRDFEAHLASTPTEEDQRGHLPGRHLPGLLRSETEDLHSRELIAHAINDYQRTSLIARIFPEIARDTMDLYETQRHRLFLTVCSVQVEISLGPEGGGITVHWQRIPVLVVRPTDMAPEQDTPDGSTITTPTKAQLDIVLVAFGKYSGLARAAVVKHGDHILSCTVWGPEKAREEIRKMILASFKSRDEKIQTTDSFRVLAEPIVGEHAWLRFAREYIMNSLPSITDNIYRDTALWHSRDTAAIDNCADLMRENGMYALLGSAHALKRMSLLGLAAGIDPRESHIDRIFHEHGYDLQDTVDDIDRCWDRYGFPRSVISAEEEGIVISAEPPDGNILIPLV